MIALCFNPRPRTGGDLAECGVDPHEFVSIHAPARGATLALVFELWSMLSFQSTPPHGGRRRFANFARISAWFQSTPPHGGRPRITWDGMFPGAVSIHAPARGATTNNMGWHVPGRGFNPRPRTGGDHE